ncbi:MAG: type I DNA topoisomerase [Bacteroidales bacterium]|nr:type I DNA topoisomerase [Bacteroidales bacterium]
MSKNLVIVESPAKAKTIKKYLGDNFDVKSSYGHIRDLSKKKLGVDIEKNYAPDYIIDDDKKKVIKELKDAVKKADIIWLASDEDREGEAIAWHLAEVLKLSENNAKRIVFNEITKTAIQKAVENPRWIDYNLVNAQQARRILDRLVGFELSELLWKKVKGATSAGRVQSVAVKLVVDRENEIKNFKSTSSYKITAEFDFTSDDGKKGQLKAEIASKIDTKKEAIAILEDFKKSLFDVSDIKVKATKKTPAAPFTTSTLQQEASRKFGFSVSRTMMLAQKLYENGKITYMRTDSTNLSGDAIEKCKNFIISNYGENYLKIRQFKTKTKGAQEAHEAIRPTEMKPKGSTDASEQKLYELILNRTLASQMEDAVFDKTTITINASESEKDLTASAEVLKFDGFLRIYNYFDIDGENEDKQVIPALKKGQKLDLQKALATQKHTNPSARYNEASLVRKLEELGIGRPSTYAPIISTIIKRSYVIKGNIEGTPIKATEIILKSGKISEKEKEDIKGKEKNKFIPTDVGSIVTGFLADHFTNILDYNFTATVEKDFDSIAEGKADWTKIIDKFYKTFHSNIKETLETAEKVTGERHLGVDKESGKNIYVKLAKYGPVVQIGDTESEEKPQFASLRKDQSIETLTLEEAIKLLKEDKNGRLLGKHPESGRPIYARIAKFGPLVQMGTYEDKEKPQFANLLKRQNIDTVTLEDALKLFSLPKELGEFEDKKVSVAIGRFGPYVRHNNKFVSLKKTDHPLEVTLERAIELIEEKREADAKKLLKEFSDDLKIIKDRWGRPCIFYKKKYFKLPKDAEYEKMTEKDCMKIVEG